MMNIPQDKKDEILVCARKMQHYNNLLIAQCDSWLSAEEGMKQMEKRIRERTTKKQKNASKANPIFSKF